MKSVIKRVEKLVIPTNKEEKEKEEIANMAQELVKKEIEKYSQIKDVIACGSFAKKTWLPQKADIDVFVLFDQSTVPKDFEDVTKKIGFGSLKKHNPSTRFAEHPYVEGEIKKTKINVVPCYVVPKGEWKSAADRSPYHLEFMQKNLTDSMRTSVRILKQFLMSNGIYGAEISMQGFSGYVAEVLVWNFKSFEGVIRHMAGIVPGQTIGKTKREFDTLISIIDPVDPQRNLAAAISNENIGKFVLLCRAFLRKPSMSFFIESKKITKSELLKNCVVISFEYKSRSPDTIWGQVKRATVAVGMQLKLGGFTVIKSRANTDEDSKAQMYFLLESPVISKYRTRKGPDFTNEDESRRFITKNSKKTLSMWVDHNKSIQSLEKRSEYQVKKFLKTLLEEGLLRSGIPLGIKADIKKGFKVSMGDSIKDRSIKKELSELIGTDGAAFSSN